MVVEIEPVDRAEPVSEWGAEEGVTGGGADKGKAGQVKAEALGPGSLADDNIQGKILKRRV